MNKRIRKKKIRDLLLAELSMQFENEDDAFEWLDTANSGLEDRSPREAISAGEIERVTVMLDEMNRASLAER